MEKIAEIESTQGYIQMHAVIPEMVTKRLDHSVIYGFYAALCSCHYSPDESGIAKCDKYLLDPR